MQFPRLTLLHLGGAATLVGFIGAAIVAATLLGQQVNTGDPSASASASVGGSDSSPTVPADNTMATLDERVAFWESRVGANATDYSSTIALIDAYLNRVRATGDLSDLERADTALDRVRSVAPAGDVRLLVERIAAVAQATGGVYDRQLVLFLADHDRDIDEAVALAEAEIATRADVYGYDALAWALYRAERFEEADAAAREALRLDTPDGRILYHAGLIAVAVDRRGEARDLLRRAAAHEAALPPLQVPALRAALDALGG